MAAAPQLVTYQAQVTLPSTLAQIRATRTTIKRLGGSVELIETQTPGLTIVRLTLPSTVAPGSIVPGIPFFPLI
jgi:hypothetical protein